MKVIGIIAEYNPFHNGHAYQIKRIKEELNADYVVVAMSGNYVQRGTPAIIDKYTRTKMALSCGVDLVLELPVLWATASAEAFAMAGVTLFDQMGCVDGICFGAETDDLPLLNKIAGILVEEPVSYRNLLSTYLKKGLSFPAARSKALCEYLSSQHESKGYALDAISSILNEPNNILAIEYLKALNRRSSTMTPYVIKRLGAGYHEKCVLNTNDTPTASATGIRKMLEQEDALSLKELAASMPDRTLEILKDYFSPQTIVTTNDFSSILGYKLLDANIDKLTEIGDSNVMIAKRILKNRMQFVSFSQFCDLCKSKDITYTRISRILLHLILGITNNDYILGKNFDYIPYLRILGFSKEASGLLKTLKATSKVPLISKLADATKLLDTPALSLLKKDIFASDLYEQVGSMKSGKLPQSEYTKQIVQIK